MLTIDRSARATVEAPPERCLERLKDVEAYPSWSSLIRGAEVAGERVRLRAEILGMPFVMDCSLEVGPEGAVLRRLPYDEHDEERYEATWSVKRAGSGAEIALHVSAALDAPGPARLVRGRIERRLVDDLLEDFARAS